MTFGEPQYFFLLLLTPALAFLLIWGNTKRNALLKHFTGELAARLVMGFSPARRQLKQILILAAVFLVTLALARPQWGYYWKEVHHRGIDIYVALDVSKSMLAQDVSPNRLERAKRKIEDLTKIVQGDRLGLIAFAGSSFVQCPLTLDYVAIQSFLTSLGVDSISLPGTSIADAIEKAAAVEGAPQEDKARALLLLTDGEDLEGSIDQAVAQAKERGVKIYAIGIGTADGAPIPNDEGGGFKKDARGEVVITKLMENSLKDITLKSGGAYVRSVPGDNDLTQIYADIKHQGTQKEFKEGREKELRERFQLPLLLAILFLLAEYALAETTVRERRRFAWKKWPRFRRAAPAVALLILLLGHFAKAGVLESDRAKGQAAYKKGDYEEAVKHFLSAQIDDPNNAKLKYDLANSYYKLGKFDEASRLYESLAEAGGPDVKEKSFYNLGNSQFRQGKMEEATKSYEKALKLDPKDADSKYNLEFVKKQLEQQKQQPKDNKDNKDKKDNKDQKEDKNQSSQNDQNQKDQNQKDQKQNAKNDPNQKNPPNPSQSQDGKDDKNKKPDQKPDEPKDAGKEKEKEKEGAGKEPEKPAEAKQSKDGKEGKDGKPPEPQNPISNDEAHMWLSRVKEKRPAAKKQGAATIRGDKDW